MNISLPSAPAQSEPVAQVRAEPDGAASLVRRRAGVLVADDEAGVRQLLAAALQAEGFSVWLAADGLEALDLYHRHLNEIAVALLDVLMPELDGPQTLTALRQVNAQVVCAFMSGDLGNYSEQQLRELGAVAVLWKPFRVAQVIDVIRRLVGPGEPAPDGLLFAALHAGPR